MRRIAIQLLGPFGVTIDGAPVTGFAYAKVRALLAYLAVEGPRPHTRGALAALLWPDQPEAGARASLSQALTTLRNALGDKVAAEPLLLADAQHVWLNPTCALEVDTTRFLAALAEAEAHPHRSWRVCAHCAELLRRALPLYRGGFLDDIAIPDSDIFDEWATTQREGLLQRALSGLERLCEREQWRGALQEALAYARQLAALDPLLETSQRTLIRLLALNGEAAAALAQHRQLQTMLDQELGAEPEAATAVLAEQIRRGDLAGLRPPAPPCTAPLPPTPLVGRGAALRDVCALVRDGGGRGVTVTGPGGIGKTRLALEAAQLLRYDFEDGVYLVELAALSDAALVAAAIARALGIKERAQQPLRETLVEQLRPKHLLLLLDNFEHVVAAAPLVAALLAACPGLHVLATSRAPLLIRAERRLAIAPLADDEAVQLFIERAQAVGAAPGGAEGDTDVYAAICRRLDRLPLAIELIAVRAGALTPRELLEQLEQPLQALAHGPRDLAVRHQSLRQAIQWSYDLLDPEEQQVFRALGAFAGGCTTEAAQAALGRSIAVLPPLEALHRASLVQRQAVADKTRFLMLETIREFALEQLTRSDEAAETQRRHAEHYAHFAMAAYRELIRADALRWQAWVAAEQPNLRAAFRWAHGHGRHETALQLATGVWRFHNMAGSMREGLEQLEAALAYREQASLEIQCFSLRAAGTLATSLNEYARARRWLEAAVEVGWRLGDLSALQPVLTNVGYTLLEQGELDDARVNLEVSVSLAQRSADPSVAKFPLGILANLHRRLGEYAQAQALCEEGLRINRALGDREGTADALRTLARIRQGQGDLARARQLCEEALALHRSLSHQFGMGLDYAVLGDIARSAGEYGAALAHYRQCLDLWRDRENMVNSASVLDSVGQTLGLAGEPGDGATLMSAAAAIRARASVRLSALEQAACDEAMRLCRDALGDAALADAWAAGRTLTLAQAVTLALRSTGSVVA